MADKTQPLTPRRGFHRVISEGEMAPGAAVLTGAHAKHVLPIFGLLRARVRIELTAGDGTLYAFFLRPDEDNQQFLEDGSQYHTTGAPSAVAVAAPNTEYLMEIDGLYGEAYLLLDYLDTAGGSTIKRVTVSAL